MQIQLTPEQILQFIIIGIKNGNHKAAIKIAEDAIEQIKENEKKENADRDTL